MNDPQRTARILLEKNTVTLYRLWAGYWGRGGNATAFEFDAYVHEALLASPVDLQLMASAVEGLHNGKP
ncbi:hypothetical protein J2Y66_000961 [Paenarthrobacter nitroguajacolicus]|uniref:hypothetical protein n=1 Tax=Paenarthrobacter TaxID=1742992 RepID=UPI00285B4116|nr:hypothetical protein [Paenarthrobacter nitroguajacolicus]MDR6986491.1 hypothetical protein [Paenarthrobacter nitroguajacolicus]